MSLDPYLYFDGNCRQAVEFYADLFGGTAEFMTFGEAPGMEDLPAAQRDRIIHATLPVFGVNMMFSDCGDSATYAAGSAVALSIGVEDEAEARRLYAGLAEGGQVQVELAPQFFGPLFGQLTDRFGITWMISHTPVGADCPV